MQNFIIRWNKAKLHDCACILKSEQKTEQQLGRTIITMILRALRLKSD